MVKMFDFISFEMRIEAICDYLRQFIVCRFSGINYDENEHAVCILMCLKNLSLLNPEFMHPTQVE